MVHRVIDRLPIWPTAFFPLFLVIIRLISFSSMWRLKERLWKRRRHSAAKETNLTHTHTLAQQKGDICLETMIFREEDNEIEANMEKKSNGEKPAERQINKIKSNDVAHALCCFQSDTVASTVCRTWVKKLYDGMAEKEEKKGAGRRDFCSKWSQLVSNRTQQSPSSDSWLGWPTLSYVETVIEMNFHPHHPT